MNKQRRAELAALAQRLDKLTGDLVSIERTVYAAEKEEEEILQKLPISLLSGPRSDERKRPFHSLRQAVLEIQRAEFALHNAARAIETAKE